MALIKDAVDNATLARGNYWRPAHISIDPLRLDRVPVTWGCFVNRSARDALARPIDTHQIVVDGREHPELFAALAKVLYDYAKRDPFFQDATDD